MTVLEKIEQQQMKKDLPLFRAGDSVRVHVKIKEGDKERIQVFEGTVIGLRRAQILRGLDALNPDFDFAIRHQIFE